MVLQETSMKQTNFSQSLNSSFLLAFLFLFCFSASGIPNSIRKPIMSYEQARTVVQSLGIQTVRQYRQKRQSQELPPGLPLFPEREYRSEWVSWREFLERGKLMKRNISEPLAQRRKVLQENTEDRAIILYNLGVGYYYGEGVKKNLRAAKEMWSVAAALGLAKAQYALGVMYFKGEGVERDNQRAIELWSAAAEWGLAQAQFRLGTIYDSIYSTQGDKKDLKKIFNLYMKAAGQGLVEAQFNVGVMYYKGEGVERDTQNAEEWWSIAAKKGHAPSLYNLTALRSSEDEGSDDSDDGSDNDQCPVVWH